MNKPTIIDIPEDRSALNLGPDWLREKRNSARAEYNQAALPPRTQHLWRYTDPNSLAELSSDKADQTTTKLASKITNDKVIAIPLTEAAEKYPELIKKHLYSLVNNQTGKFEGMNGALWSDGYFIHIPPNITVAEPIHINNLSGPAGSQVFSRLLLLVGENSEVTLLDEYRSESDHSGNDLASSNAAIEIITERDARVQYVNLQVQNSATRSFLTLRASLAAGAQMLTMPIVLGSHLLKLNYGIRLDGPGAQSNIFGLALGHGKQHIDTHTKHHHTHGQTYSNIDFKVVARDKAESAYTGLIKIEQQAAECEAYQVNRNLLLSKGAKVETIPELEILNEEVSCSHGATIGEIDPEAIFYLGARGIDHDEAVRMIVSGFVVAVIDRVPSALKEDIVAAVSKKLESV